MFRPAVKGFSKFIFDACGKLDQTRVFIGDPRGQRDSFRGTPGPGLHRRLATCVVIHHGQVRPAIAIRRHPEGVTTDISPAGHLVGVIRGEPLNSRIRGVLSLVRADFAQLRRCPRRPPLLMTFTGRFVWATETPTRAPASCAESLGSVEARKVEGEGMSSRFERPHLQRPRRANILEPGSQIPTGPLPVVGMTVWTDGPTAWREQGLILRTRAWRVSTRPAPRPR